MSASTQWTARAACAVRPELPWTVDASGVGLWEAAAMRNVCGSCPVLLDCLNAVDALDVTGGWWAGRDRDPDAATAHLDPPAWAFADTPDDDPPPWTAARAAHLDPPAWALADTAEDDWPSAPLAWLPIRSRRDGTVLGEQLALHIA